MHALRARILSSQCLEEAMLALEQEMGKDVADHLRALIHQEATWNKDDEASARSQGWGLFATERGLEIQPIKGETPRFSSDAEAYKFVMLASQIGDRAASRAINTAWSEPFGTDWRQTPRVKKGVPSEREG